MTKNFDADIHSVELVNQQYHSLTKKMERLGSTVKSETFVGTDNHEQIRDRFITIETNVKLIKVPNLFSKRKCKNFFSDLNAKIEMKNRQTIVTNKDDSATEMDEIFSENVTEPVVVKNEVPTAVNLTDTAQHSNSTKQTSCTTSSVFNAILLTTQDLETPKKQIETYAFEIDILQQDVDALANINAAMAFQNIKNEIDNTDDHKEPMSDRTFNSMQFMTG